MEELQPFFSIVIPTRNRHEMLFYSIKTILQQSFTNYELIICDNNSSQETQEVASSFDSEKIKYIRSNQSISMTENWELAVSHAAGKYIAVIADNDGFIDGSLTFLFKLLQKRDFPEVIRWEKNEFIWPDIGTEQNNQLVLRTNPRAEVLNSNDIILNVLAGEMKFQMLPMIYNSIISISLIKKIKAETGRVFNSISPDLYTGFSFSYLSKSYLSINIPITVGGTSAKSNGLNCMKKSNQIVDEFKALSEASFSPIHPDVPFIKTIFSGIYDSFLRAQEDLNIDIGIIDKRKWVDKLISTVVVYDESERDRVIDKIKKSFPNDIELSTYIDEKIMLDAIPIKQLEEVKVTFGFFKDILYLDGNKLNINNIYDASTYMANFYNYDLQQQLDIYD